MIVCDDADLGQAVAAALAGVYIASGQMCLAAERIYVFAGIYDDFVAEVVQQAHALRQAPPMSGRPCDVGAMTMPQQLDIVERLVKDAEDKGARVRVGGGRNRTLSGQFFEPTVLTDVDHSMDIMRQETFGPVMAIMRVHSEEEAVRLANDSDYGLGSTVFSKDTQRARRIARKLQAGSTCVNDFGLAYMANELPFGGVRHSGFGRLNGREGLRACTNIKAVVTDRFGGLLGHRPVKLYPVKPTDFDLTRGTIELIYRRGLIGKAKGALRLIKAATGLLG